jgi:hypothetical protein
MGKKKKNKKKDTAEVVLPNAKTQVLYVHEDTSWVQIHTKNPTGFFFKKSISYLNGVSYGPVEWREGEYEPIGGHETDEIPPKWVTYQTSFGTKKEAISALNQYVSNRNWIIKYKRNAAVANSVENWQSIGIDEDE